MLNFSLEFSYSFLHLVQIRDRYPYKVCSNYTLYIYIIFKVQTLINHNGMSARNKTEQHSSDIDSFYHHLDSGVPVAIDVLNEPSETSDLASYFDCYDGYSSSDRKDDYQLTNQGALSRAMDSLKEICDQVLGKDKPMKRRKAKGRKRNPITSIPLTSDNDWSCDYNEGSQIVISSISNPSNTSKIFRNDSCPSRDQTQHYDSDCYSSDTSCKHHRYHVPVMEDLDDLDPENNRDPQNAVSANHFTNNPDSLLISVFESADGIEINSLVPSLSQSATDSQETTNVEESSHSLLTEVLVPKQTVSSGHVHNEKSSSILNRSNLYYYADDNAINTFDDMDKLGLIDSSSLQHEYMECYSQSFIQEEGRDLQLSSFSRHEDNIPTNINSAPDKKSSDILTLSNITSKQFLSEGIENEVHHDDRKTRNAEVMSPPMNDMNDTLTKANDHSVGLCLIQNVIIDSATGSEPMLPASKAKNIQLMEEKDSNIPVSELPVLTSKNIQEPVDTETNLTTVNQAQRQNFASLKSFWGQKEKKVLTQK